MAQTIAFATRIRLYVHILRSCGLSHQALTYHIRYALDAHVPLYEYIKRSTDMATIPSIYWPAWRRRRWRTALCATS